MKPLLFILSITAAFLLSQYKTLSEQPKQKTIYFSAAYIDSVLEAGRIERMEQKLK